MLQIYCTYKLIQTFLTFGNRVGGFDRLMCSTLPVTVFEYVGGEEVVLLTAKTPSDHMYMLLLFHLFL